MIHLINGQTNPIVLTLSEKCTLSSPNFLWICKSRNTNETISFVILGSTDISTSKTRYNKFNFVTSTYFASSTNGEWTYNIYEQASTSNLNPSLATGLVEKGQFTLNDSSQFSFNTYNSTNNTYKVRDI
jgi:predicted GNAT superfamily acetyltransferase